MPQYRVLAESFIDNHRRMPGELVEYAGLPAENLEPTDAAGEAKVAKAKAARQAGMQQLIRDTRPMGGTDPEAFAKAVAAAVAEALAATDKGKKAAEAPLV